MVEEAQLTLCSRAATDDLREDRLYRLVRLALEKKVITLGRAAEILIISREDMRKRAADWAC